MLHTRPGLNNSVLHVAVIGAGAAGLCAARHITKPGSGMLCTVYEQTDKLGGTWVYTDEIDKDKYDLPIHSSMFKNLRITIPKCIIGFPDFPVTKDECYLTGEDMNDYLIEYAKHYDIQQYVKFHSHVVRVAPLKTGWEISVRSLETNKLTVELFDSVMVCNGHYSVPYIPDINGLDIFKGKVMHSHHYRCPNDVLGKSVLIVGGGPSGCDITLDILEFAKKIYFNHNISDWNKFKFSSNVEHVPKVSEITENGVIYEDKSSSQVDVILFCTGYRYNFPFLTPECGVLIEEDKYVKPFYKHLIHAYHPTLCIIGLPFNITSFPIFHIQVQFFLRALSGDFQLPNTHGMLQDIDENVKECQKLGKPVKQYHNMGPEKIQLYADMLCNIGKFPLLPRIFFKIFDFFMEHRHKTGLFFRETELYQIDDKNFVCKIVGGR